MTDISGKLVLVTGAASGIGRATAEVAAERGARVVLTDISPLDETIATIKAAGGEVAYEKSLDITDVDAVMTFAQEVHDAHGSVDVVMNVAGISAWGTVSALEHKHWRSMVEVNLMGPIHVIEAFVPAMVDAGRGGHLVNVSSAAGLIGMPFTLPTRPASSACAASQKCCASTYDVTASGSAWSARAASTPDSPRRSRSPAWTRAGRRSRRLRLTSRSAP